MQLIRGLTNLEPMRQGCVTTIGNFDGVHKGHRAVIEKLASKGKEMGLPVCVLMFEPQPLEFFLGTNAPPRLMRLREKVIQFSRLPVDNVLLLRFNQHLANLDADAFINKILLEKLNVKFLVIGDDFHFGKARRGNFALLKEKGKQHGFQVEHTDSYLLAGHRISSTVIRDALFDDDLALAERLLGRSYSICGRVAHGDKRGRTIGYPTANIKMFRKNTPIDGVFAVTVTGIDEQELLGIANVGTRPTIDGEAKVLLETHLFSFNQDIYGKYVEVHFKKKIRNEMRFDSLDQLRTQIEQDVHFARKFLQTL